MRFLSIIQDTVTYLIRSKHVEWKVQKNAIYYDKTSKFKRMPIYYDKTQHANFRGNSLYQVTKRHLSNS